MNKIIYLDKAGTYGNIPKPILTSILSYLNGMCGNASSLYSIGNKALSEVNKATDLIKRTTNAKEVYYTSGSSESNNWVINNFRHSTIISSTIEHPSILNTLKYYAQEYCLNYKLIGVDNKGIIKKDELEKALSEGAGLCTIIGVNNELGIIQNINAIYDLCHKYNCKLHTDLTQAFSHIDISKLKYDYASLSAHKFGGLQGVGTLLCNSPINSFIIGGHQQGSMRGGTYNLPGIISMGKASELYNYSPEKDKCCREIQNKFYNAFSQMTDVHFNTDIEHSISSTLNVGFKGVESESLMLLLDMDGICVSAGSACNSGSLEPSHVLKAINCPEEYIYNSIRLSWDDTLTNEDVNYTIERIMNNVKKVRGYI
jgi:putative cysteine desulfurase nifS|nr:MAG TPA: cysteine sulfinate desulfinase/cysteine desulfurase [Caudoviricetes sp.]DAV07063.1 MAG TPA: cysteine sulfinate desulfinase/cysteine desulfurase [Caudoviricetes sp.]